MRARFAVLPLAAACLVALAPRSAAAYCRTTTVNETSGYQPTQQGCWAKGTPIAWHVRDVGYSLVKAASTQIPLASATTVIDASFAKWPEASCSTTDATKHPNIAPHDLGPIDSAATDCGLIECDPTVHDAEHVIVFRDDVWPHNDPNNTLALTTVTYGVTSGEIFDADMEINTHDHLLSVASPTPAGAFDLGTVVTHEAGHFLGLSHSDDGSAVMFAHYQAGRTALAADDQRGICAIYPPASDAKSGCACGVANGTGGTTAAVVTLAIAALGARRRRTRG